MDGVGERHAGQRRSISDPSRNSAPCRSLRTPASEDDRYLPGAGHDAGGPGRAVAGAGRPRGRRDRERRRAFQGRHTCACHRGRGVGRGRYRTARTTAVVAARRKPHPRPTSAGVRARTADAGRLLHAHPHRRARQSAQQRRDRRAARVHHWPGRRGHQRHRGGAHTRGDAAPFMADHGPVTPAAAAVHHSGAARRKARRRARTGRDRARRGDDVADDRAVLGAGRDAGQALRPTGRRSRRVRSTGGARARHRSEVGLRDGGLLPGAHAGVELGARAGLRPRRLPRVER